MKRKSSDAEFTIEIGPSPIERRMLTLFTRKLAEREDHRFMAPNIPTDLISSAEAAKLTQHKSAWGFVRYARGLGLREFTRRGTRHLFWSKAEVLTRTFHEKTRASQATAETT